MMEFCIKTNLKILEPESINYDFSAANQVKSQMDEMADLFHVNVLESYLDAEEMLGVAFGGEAAELLKKKMSQEEEKLRTTLRTLQEAGEAMKKATRTARMVEEKAKQEILRKTHN